MQVKVEKKESIILKSNAIWDSNCQSAIKAEYQNECNRFYGAALAFVAEL